MNEHMADLNTPMSAGDITELLKAHRVSPTPQRMEIASVLLARPQHMSADQVMEVVNRHASKPVCKATVYNTLGLFARQGLVREVIVDNSKVFYDSNTGHHHHFYNVDTGTLIDVDEHQFQVGQLPELPAGTVADGVDVIIRLRSK